MLAACATSPTQPVEPPTSGTEQPVEVETVDTTDFTPGFLPDPSERSLAEVKMLSESMTTYQADVALEIIRSLESTSSAQLRSMIQSQSYDPEFTEWLELALQLRTVMINQSPVASAARQWSNYHFGHAVDQTEFSVLLSSYISHYPVPSQVAILLPTEGGLTSAANAIRDGIVSAYLNKPGDSELRFYSSGKTRESAIAAYMQAREDGATQIVGPLRLDSTRALASMPDPAIPVLMLNRADNEVLNEAGQAGIINSLSLSQSVEAIAVANKALSQGKLNAIVIVPDSAWGRRIENAFVASYEQGGGSVSASAQFNRANNDYSDMLTQLLKIDESKQRKRALQAQLGTPLTFEPSRRDDFDFIFLAVSPQEGRELKPLLRFHDAGDVPVYSIGRVFSGKTEPARDQDLNGIIFTAIPWQLTSESSTSAMPTSVRGGSLGKLYALGKDAWHLLPWLPLMQKDADLWFPGNVGELSMTTNGHINRQPAWAQFSEGRPATYHWSSHY